MKCLTRGLRVTFLPFRDVALNVGAHAADRPVLWRNRRAAQLRRAATRRLEPAGKTQ